MDADILSRAVYSLILRHDVVKVPELGFFIAQKIGATFSDKGSTINPPYRKLSFRSGDVQLSAQMSYNVADDDAFYRQLRVMAPFVEDIESDYKQFILAFKAELNKRRNVRLGDLGTMRATAQRDYFFIVDDELDIYPDGFGLVPISIKNRTVNFDTFAETKADPIPSQEDVDSVIFSVEEMEASNQDPIDLLPLEDDTQESEILPVDTPISEAPESDENEADADVLEPAESEIVPEPLEPVENEIASEPLEPTENEIGHEAPESAENEVDADADADVDVDVPKEDVSISSPEQDSPKHRSSNAGYITLAIIILLVAILMAILYLYKDADWLNTIIDKLLYTKEELDIIYGQ